MKRFDHHSGAHFSIGKAIIYYESAGNEKGPVLLMLHGGFGNMEDFNSILPVLADRYHIIGIDSRGHGRSSLGDEKLTYERIQHDIEALLQFLHIDKVNIIGFSDGGIVAYRLACFSNIHVEKLVTIGATWSVNDVLSTRELFQKITAESWMQKFPDTYKSYSRLNPAPDFIRLTRSVISMWVDTGATGHPDEAVRNINAQLLVIRGDEDHLVSRRSIFSIGALVRNSRILNLPFAGHVAFEDQPAIFNSILERFMQ